MASLWQRAAKPRDNKGAGLVAPPAGTSPRRFNIHSVIHGNGQHSVLPPRTNGQPWIGHKGNSPQMHAFAPAETFGLQAGGVNMPAPAPLRATTSAAINSITGAAAGTHQLAPGGGVNSPAVQTTPRRVGF